MKIKKSTIPTDSLVNAYLPADYSDVFVCEVISNKKVSPDDLLIAFWTDFPGWVNTLFEIRNFLVKFVGLKADKEDSNELENCIRTGGTSNFTSVPAKSSNETVMLLADKHLNAYLSAHVGGDMPQQKISVITLVHFNNKLGNTYFFFIRPFHQIIVKSMMKRVVKKMLQP